ncbi:MAG: aminopeptidase [Candidatus Omnitrophica bacterium]|nr:aminopeptidase [Candidatus Omnitrophota bacterium]
MLKTCLGHRRGESVLLVTDEILCGVATLLFNNCLSLGIEATLITMRSRTMHGEEPPRLVARAMRDADIVFLLTSWSLSHTKARNRACKKYGVRIASLPSVTLEVLRRSIHIDYAALDKHARRIAARLRQASRIRVTAPGGTDLTMEIGGRRICIDNGLYLETGAFGNLPAGEVCLSPREGTTNGRLVIDGSFAGLGKLHKPVTITVKDGYATAISSSRLERLLRPFGRKGRTIAELGIGLNPRARMTGVVLEDEKALKTAHIALGNNVSFGGKVAAGCHLDGVFLSPKITVVLPSGREKAVRLR